TRALRWLAALLALASGLSMGRLFAGDQPRWDGGSAARYLDSRAAAWFAYPGADRGRGADKVSCVSCHTLLPFALARPVGRRTSGEARPAELEQRVLEQVRRRVAHWDELDTPRFKLFYDFDDDKKVESRGTEAVLSTLILARDDRHRGLPTASKETREAL